MKMPVQITYRKMEPSDAVTARVEAEAAKLAIFFDRITSCRVVIEAPHRHHKHGERFHVRIDLAVPGTELVVNYEPTPRATLSRVESPTLSKKIEVHPEHKNIYVTVRNAFSSARRQLQDYVKRLRGDVKAHGHINPVSR